MWSGLLSTTSLRNLETDCYLLCSLLWPVFPIGSPNHLLKRTNCSTFSTSYLGNDLVVPVAMMDVGGSPISAEEGCRISASCLGFPCLANRPSIVACPRIFLLVILAASAMTLVAKRIILCLAAPDISLW